MPLVARIYNSLTTPKRRFYLYISIYLCGRQPCTGSLMIPTLAEKAETSRNCDIREKEDNFMKRATCIAESCL